MLNPNIENAIRRGAELKNEIAGATTELRKINEYLAENAEYKNGSNTGEIIGAGFSVKVIKRDNTTWNQDKLNQVREHFPATFEDCFKRYHKPLTTALNKTIEKSPDFAKAVEWCRQIKPGAPSVTYTSLQEEPF